MTSAPLPPQVQSAPLPAQQPIRRAGRCRRTSRIRRARRSRRNSLHEAVGLISGGHVVEVRRADLIGRYIGQTAPKPARGLREGDGWCAVAPRGGNDHGAEAIAQLLVRMDNHRDDLIVIVIAAGHLREMDRFLDADPGLRSRFGATSTFGDDTTDELTGSAS